MFVLGVGEDGALWHRGNEGSQLPEEMGRERGRERLKMSCEIDYYH